MDSSAGSVPGLAPTIAGRVQLALNQACSARPDDGVVVGVQPDVLAAISSDETRLAVWNRELGLAIRTWLHDQKPGALPTGRVLVALTEIDAALHSLFPDAHAGCPSRILARDIRDLAALYGRLAGTDIVDLRLEEIEHDACWRFHLDAVKLRLVTTYLGPGTELVPSAHAGRALRLQRRYDGPIVHIPTGSVALFKGAQAGPSPGIVHRSPAVMRKGLRRLFLSINAPSSASPDLWRPS